MRACIVCGEPSPDSRCSKHQRKKRPWVKSKPSTYGWAWQRRRLEVLREEPTCRLCGRPTGAVDHIIPKAEGGTDERSNLQGLCQLHHDQKTKAEALRGSRRRRAG